MTTETTTVQDTLAKLANLADAARSNAASTAEAAVTGVKEAVASERTKTGVIGFLASALGTAAVLLLMGGIPDADSVDAISEVIPS